MAAPGWCGAACRALSVLKASEIFWTVLLSGGSCDLPDIQSSTDSVSLKFHETHTTRLDETSMLDEHRPIVHVGREIADRFRDSQWCACTCACPCARLLSARAYLSNTPRRPAPLRSEHTHAQSHHSRSRNSSLQERRQDVPVAHSLIWHRLLGNLILRALLERGVGVGAAA